MHSLASPATLRYTTLATNASLMHRIILCYNANMHISWLGNTAVKIQEKIAGKDISIIINPYKPEVGAFPRSLTADIALYTHGPKNSVTISGTPFVLDHAGECETHGILITAPPAAPKGQTILRIDVDHIAVAHLGMLSEQLTDEQLEMLGNIDILLVPTGGAGCYTPDQAKRAIQLIEPSIVIPMAYKCDTDPTAMPVEDFIKVIGTVPEEYDKKVIIKKKDINAEEMRVFVVSKE